MRDYGLPPQVWDDPGGCEHEWVDHERWLHRGTVAESAQVGATKNPNAQITNAKTTSQFCQKCNAWRGSLGLEPTPELYIQHIVQVFREIKRVLRFDGICMVNLGDSYFSSLQSSKNYVILREDLTEEELLYVAMEIQRELPELWEPYQGRQGEGSLPEMLRQKTQDREHRTSKGTTKGVLSPESTEIYGKNQETVSTAERGSNSENGRKMRLLWREGENVSLFGPYQRRGTEGLSEKRRATGSLEKSDQGRLAKEQISGSLLELQCSIRLVRLLYSLKFNVSDLPKSIKVYFKEENKLKSKDLCGIPWRVALALQSDGWWLRSDIIWNKPNPMPESVTDRPTRSHEYLFLLTKSAKYFYDAEAVKEKSTYAPGCGWKDAGHEIAVKTANVANPAFRAIKPTRNLRSVWTIATQPFKDAHFATFPEKLVEPCIKAGTSEKGCCPECQAPWVRVVETRYEKTQNKHEGRHCAVPGAHNWEGMIPANKISKTIDWRPSCECIDSIRPGGQLMKAPYRPIPCTVLDCFGGSGRTAIVAKKLGRKAIIIELKPEYCEMPLKELSQERIF